MPSFLGYIEKFGKLPVRLTFSLAALMAFYQGDKIEDGALIGNRDGKEYRIMDDIAVMEFFRDNCRKETSEFVKAFLSNVDFFGQDLTTIDRLTDTIAAHLNAIKENGMRDTLCKLS